MTTEDADLLKRIEAAIERITSGQAPMRVPVDNTDPDVVLADCFRFVRARLEEAEQLQTPPVATDGFVMVPREPTDEWAERFCHNVNWHPDGAENKFVEGRLHTVSFRDLAKGYIRAMLAAAPQSGKKDEWLPMETAPRGGGAELVTDPKWVEPPKILLRFGDEAISVAYWDWYYAEGGCGYRDGFAWVEPCSGEPLNWHYSTPPNGWMPLPSPPSKAEGE